MTTTTKSRSLKVRSLADFKHHNIIGRRFGDLRLIAVRRKGNADIADTTCIVTCSEGHQTERPWRQLRNRPCKPVCLTCHPEYQPKKEPVTNMTNEQLITAIGKLPPDRRRLMDLILAGRRRAGGEDIRLRDLLGDAFAYARDVVNVERELEDLAPTNLRETYGLSTLSSPDWKYVAVE